MKKLLISILLFACIINIHYVSAKDEINLADVPYGDVNGDGKVDTKDYILIRKMILSFISKSNEADINKDGNIDAKDYIIVRKVILGIIKSGDDDKKTINTPTQAPTSTPATVIQDNKITITQKTATFTGKGIEATAKAASGTTVTLTYYSDSSCKTKTTTTNATSAGGAPKTAGTYYAIGKVKATDGYKAATSACTKAVVINKANDTVTVTAKTTAYTGKGIATTTKASSGSKITVTYYSDSSCKTKTTTTNATEAGGTPKSIGTYYAIAASAGNTNYNAGKSTCSKAVVIKEVTNRIHFIKVCTTSGDAILLESNGHYALIDTGCANTKTDVYNYLNELGVTKLDFILITHNHADHRGGANYLIGKYKSNIGKFYTKTYDGSANSTKQRESFQKALDTIIDSCKKYNIPVSYIDKNFTDGGKITFGNMTIKLYNTQHYIMDTNHPTRSGNDNTNSVLQLITVNGYKVLLTGDLYNEYMNRWLLANLSKKSEFKNIDVMKMPHHGYSSCAFKMGDSTKKEMGWNFGQTSMHNLSPDHIIVTNSKSKGNACAQGAGGSNIPRYYVNEDGVKSIIVNLKTSGITIKTVKQS